MKRKKAAFAETTELQFDDYFKMLINESDRGSVLLKAARLDALLEELHRTYIQFVAKPKAKFINKLFSAHAPLASFSAIIELAFGFGLVAGVDYLDLNLLRGLRKDAAHTVNDFACALPEIRKHTGRFTAPRRVFQEFPEKLEAFRSLALTEEACLAGKKPADDAVTSKLYFLSTGMCLSIIMDGMTMIVKNDLKDRPYQANRVTK